MTTSGGPPQARWVLHVDLDQFIAAVEVLRRPELAGLPLIVGGRGDPTERAVVSTASYEAREYGVGSGMPLRLAARKCPEAVILPVDAPAYEAASAVVMATLRAQEWDGAPVDVEVLGWDEAFLAAREPREDPVAFAEQLRAAVLAATRLHCSVGIGNNKLQAKIATDFGKPRGVYRITDETWFEEMGDRPTRALWGIGAKTAKRLAALGIDTVRQLAESDVRVLAAEIGPTMGPWFHRLGRGVDTSQVDPEPYVPRAHGREETFQADLEDWAEVEEAARRLARRAVADIDAEGRPAARVGIKVRFKPFLTVTRSLTLPEPSNDPEVLGAAAVELLGRVDRDRPVRLLGVRLEMTEPAGGY
ncbi:DNA polymerase IV [Nocardioides sp. cx-173]|uniref:DNA polymerase IV n=1 Tax=Nocardioides sp. cx-173 TaxID=2898796 RepID=UPI001E5D360A|nr:DNA polymerase IV [Nocardioides sp. cx-173]MCD4526740.1 DNA polymerase IV [Nocardioides sp. cx-173]UGB42518.1 DNA polymerase IV [Nocardioides sp. cx-173]